MFDDARSLSDGETLQADICIVGAGAAGITSAREFINHPYKVIFLESGDLNFKHTTQLLYKGENVGHRYFQLEFTRQRYFGGSTNKWGGRCRPLDEIDFKERDWIPHSGWPFDKATLDPFYHRAQEVCKMGPYEYQSSYWQSEDKKAINLKNSDLETKVFQYSPQLNFGEAYKDQILNAENIQTLVNANVTEIELDIYQKHVTALNGASLQGSTFKVRASHFLLAASALENTRLLLVSNGQNPKGVGNKNDLVGRYFMEHFFVFDGVFNTDLKTKHRNYYKVLNYKTYEKDLEQIASISLTEKAQQERKMLNACSFFVKRSGFNTADEYYSQTGQSIQYIGQMISHDTAPSLKLFTSLFKLISNIESSSTNGLNWIKNRIKPTVFTGLWNQYESIPNPDSRVTLSAKKDRFDKNKLKLDWRLTEQDFLSYQNYRQLLKEELEKVGLGYRSIEHETDYNGWPVTLRGGKHHMGTTRMHKDSLKGVVDENCKVHGIDNLYIAW